MTEKAYVAHITITAVYLKLSESTAEMTQRNAHQARLGNLAERLARALERRIQSDPEKFLAMIEQSKV